MHNVFIVLKGRLILFFNIVLLVSFSNADSLTVMMGGDVMLASWGVEEINKNGLDYPIQKIKHHFSESDLNMCNLEAPLTNSNEKFPDKTFTFKMPPHFSKILQKLNIHYVTLANNHTMDFGESGLAETIKTLRQSDIYFSGAGLSETEAVSPAIISIKNQKIGIIAAGAIFPEEFWATDTTAGIFFPWREKLIRTLDSTRTEVDYLFVTFHWGAERRETPKEYQKGLARLCINHGADLVWGHHPHVIQGIEFYKNKPVIYSLGNFIFASFSKTANGMVAKAVFSKRKLVKLELLPLDVDNFKSPVQPSFLQGQKKKVFIEKVNALSDSIRVGQVKFDAVGNWLQPR